MATPHNPTEHRMTRRSHMNNYSLPGIYHVTLHVADGIGHPLGRMAGDASLPDGTNGAPHVELSAIGQMVRQELLGSIPAYYPMVEVQDYVVMPEHMHFILEVHEPIVSRQQRPQHLGQVIAGFKKGCNRRYWELTGQAAPDRSTWRGETAATASAAANSAASAAANSAASAAANSAAANSTAASGSCPAVCPQGHKVPSRGATGRQPLFAEGYVDVMPLRRGQLQQQREYIRNNPRSRLLRSQHPDLLHTRRGGISTALSVNALLKYVSRECAPGRVTTAVATELQAHLLTTDMRRGKPAAANAANSAANSAAANAANSAAANAANSAAANATDMRRGKPAAANSAAASGSCPAVCPQGIQGTAPPAIVDCDTYGDRSLLQRPLLPVVCHRRDKKLFAQQKERCLQVARQGVVLVSARIAHGEQEIIDATLAAGLPVVLIADNGMPDRYHPSAERMEQCLAGRLLIVTPWQYHYVEADEGISEPWCKAMNAVAQALCRTADNWWHDDGNKGQ